MELSFGFFFIIIVSLRLFLDLIMHAKFSTTTKSNVMKLIKRAKQSQNKKILSRFDQGTVVVSQNNMTKLCCYELCCVYGANHFTVGAQIAHFPMQNPPKWKRNWCQKWMCEKNKLAFFFLALFRASGARETSIESLERFFYRFLANFLVSLKR